MNPPSSSSRTPKLIVAGVVHGPDGQPNGFLLRLDQEVVHPEPGHTWFQMDHYKWVMRGLIEAPQSFVAHPDGSLEVNGETLDPAQPDAAGRLAGILNKHHLPTTATPAHPAGPPSPANPKSDPKTFDRVRFRVHLDPLGHLLVEALRPGERIETGLRGLAHLAEDGWIKHFDSIHVDPLQRHLELDGLRFECSREGAAALERTLNERYAPTISALSGEIIEVRENSAASSGFDLQFWVHRAGTRIQVKEHLGQGVLEMLQDHAHCDLLRPGIILRLTPPYLYFRRRNSDGGEEHVPGLDDVKYRGLPAPVLQQLFNHPLIRQSTGQPDASEPVIPVVPAPLPPPAAPVPSAFQPPPKSPPPSAVPANRSDAAAKTIAPPSTSGTPPSAPPEPVPAEDAELASIFREQDPHRINEEVFRQLADGLGLPVQDLLLSLPRIFEDRRFEILDFNAEEIAEVMQLRTAHFYGFYLTHIGPERIDLVYACHGTHLEWGTDKCALQPSAGSETVEFREPALLGLAQDPENHFVFVVTPRYRDWIRPYERACGESFALFVTPTEWKAARDRLHLLWPVPPPTTT